MKKSIWVILLFGVAALPVMAAYQYNVKGNQGWLSFDGDTTLAFDLTLDSRKDKDNGQDNYIDRGQGFADYGWYNLDTGAITDEAETTANANINIFFINNSS